VTALSQIAAADHAVRAWIVAHRIGQLDSSMWLASVVGRGGMVWIALAAIVAALRRDPPSLRDLVRTAVILLVTSLVVDHALKPLVDRERPFVSTPQVRVIGGRPNDSSFPSGHAANAFAGAVALTEAVPHAALAWWALALLIAYSRVYLGVHYPLDVLGGAAIGLGCAWLVSAIWQRSTRSRAAPH
jgi:undecaprenyl-diphosphatase